MVHPAQMFDTFWERLVKARYAGEALTPAEQAFYDLSIVAGEMFSGGFAGYFERDFQHYDRQMDTLHAHGFADVVEKIARGRSLLFGEQPLTQNTVDQGLSDYLDLDDDDPLYQQIDDILEELYPRCEDIMEYRAEYGLHQGFYERIE
jgi:hypothetical protein